MNKSQSARQSLPPPREVQSTANGGISPLAAAVARKQRLKSLHESKGTSGAVSRGLRAGVRHYQLTQLDSTQLDLAQLYFTQLHLS